MKIAGHFFDYRKIENELGCLLLFGKYCPALPVPEPLAWSATGKEIETVDGRVIKPENDESFSDHAWILTSAVARAGLEQLRIWIRSTVIAFLKQLAEYVTMWRTYIPESPVWGNLRIQTEAKKGDIATTFSDLITGKAFAIDAFLLNTFYWPSTMPYYSTLAEDQLCRLKTEPQFQSDEARVWYGMGELDQE